MLGSVYVNKDWRRKGIFKAFFQTLKEKSEADPNCICIRLQVAKDNE